MPNIATVPNPTGTAAIDQYFGNIERLSREALAGSVNEAEYRAELVRLTATVSALEFLLAGGRLAGAGQRVLRQKIRQAQNSATVLAADLFDGRYSAIEETDTTPAQTAVAGFEKLRNRLGLWTFTAASIFTDGQVYGDPAVVYRWVVGPTEHCRDCLRLNGTELTAVEWQRIGIRPQSPDLACGGWQCQCELRRL